MRKKLILSLFYVASFFSFISCKTSAPVTLNGEYSVEKVMDVPGKPEAFVLFNDTLGLLSANMGCNIINANYKFLEGNKLKIENGLSTKMMCPDPALEDAFLSVLDKIAAVKEQGGKLEMLDAEKNCLVTLIKR